MKGHLVFGAILGAALLGASADAAVLYTVTDLGTFGGTASEARGINDAGQVAGTAYLPSNAASHAFFYSGGTRIDLGTLDGTDSRAFGINSSGQIVGWVLNASVGNSQRPFLWNGSNMVALGVQGSAMGINDGGQVVGVSVSYHDGSWYESPFLYNGSMILDLGTLGGKEGRANAINSLGQIVGSANTAQGATHAFLYDSSNMTDLGTLGGTDSWARGISASGEVVGVACTANDLASHAFLYTEGNMIDLGTFGGPASDAFAMNDFGSIVGEARTVGNDSHAFLYAGGVLYDLNDLVDANCGWTLGSASDINNRGEIVGRGLVNGEWHGFLLTPVPEPATLSLLVLGGLALFRRRRAA